MKINNNIVTKKAKAVGFDLVGFAKANVLGKESEQLKNWLESNYQAGMEYMGKNFEKRKDVKQILPNAKSVISLGLNYYISDSYSNDKARGKVSRYAWGKDYQLIIWAMLDELEEELNRIDPEFESISYVDTGPVMDKAWAVRAGIGWLGKHTNVINREMGSWFFIANIITNYEFDYSEPIQDFCGTCTACIDACPTNAIIQEYCVDANRCISFLTIENKGKISEEFEGKFDGWLFGCDICQDVCPWNQKFPIETLIKDYHPQNKELNLAEIDKMAEIDFKERFRVSPIKRAKLGGLKRNALFLKKNN